MPKNPLAEVFGYPVSNMSQDAVNHREGRLCPYHNPSGLNCTKTSATDPLGVCSIFDRDKLVVTCPVRLRQDLIILADAARFFFPNKLYVALTEAHLKDRNGKSTGNIDIVLAALDEHDKVVDFCAVEVQGGKISSDACKVTRDGSGRRLVHYAGDFNIVADGHIDLETRLAEMERTGVDMGVLPARTMCCWAAIIRIESGIWTRR